MNRKYILAISLVFSMLPNCFGQLFIGPKAGLQAFKPFFGNKDDRADVKFRPRPGLNLGLASVVEVKENFALHFEVTYSQKGKEVRSKLDNLLKQSVTYNHLDIPLLFTRRFDARLGGDKAYQWYLNAGPNISYWLGGSGKLETGELIFEEDVSRLEYDFVFNQESFDEKQANINHPNRLQLGLNAGGGMVFKPNKGSMLIVDFRLEMGSTFVGKKDSSVEFPVDIFDYVENLRAVNGGIKVSVAYLFDMNLSELKKGKSTRNSKRKR